MEEGTWRTEGSIDYNTLLQLHLFGKHEGKWGEVPSGQYFWALKENKGMCQQSSIGEACWLLSLMVDPGGKGTEDTTPTPKGDKHMESAEDFPPQLSLP